MAKSGRVVRSPDIGIRDAQAKKVYQWQWSFEESKENHHLSKREIMAWVKWACRKLKLPIPRVRIRLLPKHKSHSYYNIDKHEFGFLPSHRNVFVVLHEIAHLITSRLYGYTVADHGPEFMGVFVFLLEQSHRWPLGTAFRTATAHGLAIDGQAPRAVRRAAKGKEIDK